MRKPLSSNRVLAKIQKIIIAPSILRWLNDVAVHTLHRGESTQLASFVEELISVSSLPEYIKSLAVVSRLGFLTGEIAPLSVLQHGDLGFWNVLRAPSQPAGFIIIDWPGATVDGSPFFDLVKFASSIGATPKQLLQYLQRYSDSIECNAAMALPYILAGLGRLHLELEHFPENRFIALCEQKIGAVQSALHCLTRERSL
jgi:hypothetical protein